MNHPIVKKKKLNHLNYLIRVKAPQVAERFQAGQFVIIRMHEKGERIPLTVAEVNKKEETITLVFQVVGKSTLELSSMKAGEALLNVVGPLGNPTKIKKIGRVICVGGGTGIACIYPIIKAMGRAGNEVTSVIGAQTASLLILEDEIKKASHQTFVATDDGSRGYHGFVTDILKRLIHESTAKEIGEVILIGPAPMMKVGAEVTRPYGIKTLASLNTIMVDGTGMCGGCRVFVNGEMSLTCIDGPEFDAHEVNFDEVIRRLDMFKEKEKLALENYKKKEKNHENRWKKGSHEGTAF
ncbi:sulfide/dihydroorotate dehydrogenase-like FAD/NAD-binding protein [bacterium]|nr:sulfide/dihydroorotate dehydrogenase-like FAD/NAD-binding protein [bacterium]